MWEERDITSNDLRIRVSEGGNASGTPVLLVHGFLTDRSCWAEVADELAAHHRVVVLDLPGFGHSAKPSPDRFAYTLEAFSEAIANVLAAYRLGPMHIVAHCVGGGASLMLAAVHPELVKRCVVINPLVFPMKLSRWARLPLWPFIGSVLFKQALGATLFATFAERFLYDKTYLASAERLRGYYSNFNAPAARESAFATYRAMQDARTLAARLGRIQAPTLVLWGRNDAVFQTSLATRISRGLVHGRLDLLDCGHSPHEELPLPVSQKILEFLGSSTS